MTSSGQNEHIIRVGIADPKSKSSTIQIGFVNLLTQTVLLYIQNQRTPLFNSTRKKVSTVMTTAPAAPPPPPPLSRPAIGGGKSLLPITTATALEAANKLRLIPFIFLIYFEVAGGPYGEEPVVKAAGPLLGILGFVIFPFIWSGPECLITAELATAYPGNGGFVIWADRAFGPFWGSMMGTWKFLSGVINIASFPALAIGYLEKLFPVFESGPPRYIAIILFTLLLAFLNYTGLSIVGWFSVALGVVSLAPFLVLSAAAVPQIKPHRWRSLGQRHHKKDWKLYFNTLFWNLNFWDNVSTMAGEVHNPSKTFPLGLSIGVVMTCLGYLMPLLAVTGAVELQQDDWDTGFMAIAAGRMVGNWLKIWIEIGAVLSAIGLFEAQLSSSAYQVEGMAEIGFLPKFCSARSKWFNTPWIGILLSTAISLAMSCMSFDAIISSANFMYALGMLLEFASFLWLRWKRPELKRPYRVPMRLGGLSAMCSVPSAFLVYIMVIGTKTVYLMGGLMTLGGIGWFFLMKHCKKKRWFAFSDGYQEEE